MIPLYASRNAAAIRTANTSSGSFPQRPDIHRFNTGMPCGIISADMETKPLIHRQNCQSPDRPGNFRGGLTAVRTTIRTAVSSCKVFGAISFLFLLCDFGDHFQDCSNILRASLPISVHVSQCHTALRDHGRSIFREKSCKQNCI